VNMYDSCICTVGLIQWCEAGQFSVSDMLGAIISGSEVGAEVLIPLLEPMKRAHVSFYRNPSNRWRFFFSQKEISSREDQAAMFFLDSGKKGEWSEGGKAHAKQWCERLVEVFGKEDAIAAQRNFTCKRLHSWFTLPYARKVLDSAPKTHIGHAFTACFLSFAANNPTWADKYLRQAVESSKAQPWSVDWLVDCLEAWTHGPGKTIYPHRYNKIRPVVERLYGIDLPDLAGDLKDSLDAHDVQAILVRLGYDLGKGGPGGNGVDGKWGNKSQAALADFQLKNGLLVDGWPDVETNAALLRAA
jgi:hypothetical protein